MKSFRHSAGFGKRIEFWVIGEMLKQNFDVYIPLVDDRGVDAIVRRSDGSFLEIQIKARSKNIKESNAALFAAITHEDRPNYCFVFYSDRLKTTWIMSSKEFIKEANQNVNGKNKGKYSIWFNGCRKNGDDVAEAYAFPRFEKYVCNDFERLNTI